MVFTDWDEFMRKADKDLLRTEMRLTGMNKGVLHYGGEIEGKKISCFVSEVSVSDYCYAIIEPVSDVTQGYYTYLTIDGDVVLNTH